VDDATLDEFGGDDGQGGDDHGGDEPSGSGRETDPDPEAASTTFAWTPGGEPCADCGVVVECRWRRGTDLVCADCLDWG